MSNLILNRTRFLKLMTLLLVGGFLGLSAMKTHSGETNASPPLDRAKQEDKEEKENNDQTGKYLFVWAGDQGRKRADGRARPCDLAPEGGAGPLSRED